MFIYKNILILLFSLAYGLTSYKIPKTGTPPDARKHSAAAYDSTQNRMIIFSGSSSEREYYNDIWSFDFGNYQWSQLIPSTSLTPDPRVSPAIFYDKNLNRLLIFGGKTYVGLASDIWSFDLDFLIWEKIDFSSCRFHPTSAMASVSFTWNKKTHYAIYGGKSPDLMQTRLYIFDFENANCTIMPNQGDLPVPGGESRMIFYKDSLFVWGGLTYDFNYDQSLYAYNLTTQSWSKPAISGDLPTGRMMFDIAEYSDCLYVFPGFNSNFNSGVNDIWRIKLSDLTSWEKVPFTKDSNTAVRSEATSIFVNSTLYQFSGALNTNDLISIDLSQLMPKYETVTEDWVSPPARMRFSMARVEKYLIVFGGIGSNDELFNDIWTFDTVEEVWESLDPADNLSPRSGQATTETGFGMVVFGGEDSSGLLNDFYVFSLASESWHEIPSIGSTPSPRKGACLKTLEPFIILFGGITKKGFSNDIWVYKLWELSWENITPAGSSVLPMAWHECYMYYDDDWRFYALFGKLSGDLPNKNIYKFSLGTKSWETTHTFQYNDIYTSFSEQSMQVFNTFLISIGGEFEDYYSCNFITLINITNFETETIEYMEDSLFSHQSSYFIDKLYVYGGSLSINSIMPGRLVSSILYKIAFNDSRIRYPCSPGSYKVGPECKICPVGTYSENYDAPECEKCPVGTYLDRPGAASANLCIPCKYGSYTNVTGAGLCKQCPAGMECEIGSTSPSIKMSTNNEFNHQPEYYEGGTETVNKWVRFMEVLFSILSVILVLIAVSSGKLSSWVAKADIYDDKHNEDNQPMYKRKTYIGGLFSLLTTLWAFFIVIQYILQQSYDNVIETKSLIPLLHLYQQAGKFSGDISVSLSLYNYGGTCVKNGSCAAGLSLTWMNTNSDQTIMECEFFDKNCIVSTTCKNCEISTDASLVFNFTESSSYGSFFLVEVTADSAIPNEPSSYSVYAYPPKDKVMIGQNPNYVNFIMTPSLFLSDVSTWKNNQTGYLISLQNTKLGSSWTVDEMAYYKYVSIVINFQTDTTGLLTARTINMDFMLFISTLFGSISGIVDLGGFLMEFFEQKLNEIKEKRSTKIELSHLAHNVRKFLGNFSRQPKFKKLASKNSTIELDSFSYSNIF
ncbi:LZTR1_7 [Blepharisma stoltei]|uniref:Tyrosine-protein kinase ephrin type A/B receptor-like domain-containing protein n=1 Tax=Blepharisma stoltei TaxID=1481888 RepID=A0AAU9JJ93_9CILI|nr:unnamed protein product [Blepharisma stoltei]